MVYTISEIENLILRQELDSSRNALSEVISFAGISLAIIFGAFAVFGALFGFWLRKEFVARLNKVEESETKVNELVKEFNTKYSYFEKREKEIAELELKVIESINKWKELYQDFQQQKDTVSLMYAVVEANENFSRLIYLTQRLEREADYFFDEEVIEKAFKEVAEKDEMSAEQYFDRKLKPIADANKYLFNETTYELNAKDYHAELEEIEDISSETVDHINNLHGLQEYLKSKKDSLTS